MKGQGEIQVKVLVALLPLLVFRKVLVQMRGQKTSPQLLIHHQFLQLMIQLSKILDQVFQIQLLFLEGEDIIQDDKKSHLMYRC